MATDREDIDGSGPTELLSGGRWPSGFERVEAAWTSWSLRRRRGVALVVGVLVMGVGTLAVHVLRQPPPVGPVRLTGLSIVAVPDAVHPGKNLLVARYRAVVEDGDTRVSIRRVIGPGVRSMVSSQGTGARSNAVTVSVVPDCRPSATAPSPYALELSSTNPSGRTAVTSISAPVGLVDWEAAIRQQCLADRAGSGLHVDALRARPDRQTGRITLLVTLHSTLREDLQIHVIDIADIDTLAAADTVVLPGGARRQVRVRLAVADCASPVSLLGAGASEAEGPNPSLTWSVGPANQDPTTLVGTALSSGQVAKVAAAVRTQCEPPPGTTIRLTRAARAAPSSVVRDTTGVTVVLHLQIRSPAGRVVVGDKATHLTADARVALTRASVLPRQRSGTVIMWHASCGPSPSSPPLLPIELQTRGQRTRYSVPLAQRGLAVVYAQACGYTLEDLSGRGWTL